MKQSVNILLSGGGTGGHIYPAVAIANELKKRHSNANILFVGAKDRMEMEKVPQAGYEIIGLNIAGIQRSLSLQNLSFPFKLIHSLYKAGKILRNFKPHIVIGTGGFASGPTLYMASRKGIPCLIQEQNSYPGITNKILAKHVEKICVAYDGLERFFPNDKLVKTGNPVREDLLTVDQKRAKAMAHFSLDLSKRTLVILGGSLGARAINRAVESHLDQLLELEIQIVWQCGRLYYEEYKTHGDREGVQVFEFIKEMDLLYAAADVLISRAGAGSISELCIVGKPVIFIPSPNVAEDHQTMNARSVSEQGAAVLLPEKEIEELPEKVRELIADKELRDQLGQKIKTLALPYATGQIADEVEELIK